MILCNNQLVGATDSTVGTYVRMRTYANLLTRGSALLRSANYTLDNLFGPASEA
jgi:hypothetical protein